MNNHLSLGSYYLFRILLFITLNSLQSTDLLEVEVTSEQHSLSLLSWHRETKVWGVIVGCNGTRQENISASVFPLLTGEKSLEATRTWYICNWMV